jgi:hypothetical protein
MRITFILILATFAQMPPAGAAAQPYAVLPWQRQYKIEPNESSRLTPADMVGPDGLVYPNWTKCGVQGGIPNVTPALSVEKFGAKPLSSQM